MGSRFGVLQKEGEKAAEDELQEGPTVLENTGRTGVSELLENPRSDSFARNRGKIGGKSNRKMRSKQPRKEKEGGLDDLSTQRLEKRNRGDVEYEVGNSELMKRNDGKATVEVEGCETLSEQGMEGRIAFNGDEMLNDKEKVEGFVLDPGEGATVIALEGRFWAGPDALSPECSLVASTKEELMGIDGGPQAQVTKSEKVDRLSCVDKLGFDGMAYIPSLGRSGGILAAWKSVSIVVEITQLDRQLINLRCRFPRENWFYMTALYAIPDNAHKLMLWNQLNHLASSMVMSWAMVGDFNDVASLDERTGGIGGCALRCSIFSDRLQACKLMDLGAIGPKFTWRGPKLRNGRRLFERLDRVVANGDFLSSFPGCSVQG
ncbi:hypothetical protein K1719_002255 [Acacia pycnantha]|nr:hypothetical protein K1719_002255 [Acacia pycnantha]